MKLKTVKIVSPVSDGNPHGFIVINESDLTEGHVLFGADPANETPDGATKEDLIAKAQAAGIEIDRRWGPARLKAVMDDAKSEE